MGKEAQGIQKPMTTRLQHTEKMREKVDAIVRDITAVGSISKSEARRRIEEIIRETLAWAEEQCVQKVDNLYGQEIVEVGNAGGQNHEGYLKALEHVRIAIINSFKEIQGL